MEIKLSVPGISLGVNTVKGVEVRRGDRKARDLINEISARLSERITLERLKDHPVVKAYRSFYWRINIDPTKQRPSGEALARRALRGVVPSINNVVDGGNLASMETFVPIGLYDLDKIKGGLELRFAKKGEVFLPIGGEEEQLSSNQIVLADEEKVLHVFPYRDSKITMITNATKNVLIVACGVPGVGEETLLEACRRAAVYITQLAGGKSGECRILRGV